MAELFDIETADSRRDQARAQVQRELFEATEEAQAIKKRYKDLWRLNQLLSHPPHLEGEPVHETKKLQHERRILLDDLGYETAEPATLPEPLRQSLLVEVFNKARKTADRYDMLCESSVIRLGQSVSVRSADGVLEANWLVLVIAPDGSVVLEKQDGHHTRVTLPTEEILAANTGRAI